MRIAVLAVALASLVGSMARAEPPSPNLFESSQNLRPLVLRRTLFDIPEGKVWLRIGNAAPLCDVMPTDRRWKAGAYTGDVVRLSPVFDEEVRSAGLKGGSDNLFESEIAPGTLVVGAVVKDLHAQTCGNTRRGLILFKMGATMAVEWQVYDPARKVVIARVATTASAPEMHGTRDGIDSIVAAAFRMNVRAFLAEPEIIQLARTQAEDPDKRATPADRSTLLLALAKDTKTPIPDAVGSVVLILTESGSGSGFLISPDGYLLTNHHVVGAAKVVRIRWSDGFETTGEVLRSDKRRDVALIKSSAHSRQPLYLRTTLARAGDTVFAIGTPLDLKFQGTVTRGIVSAYRILDGLNILQSDVSVNHGNSGGPLMDENGRVIGITVSGVAPNDTPVGLNFFIPIGDALDFLAIKAAP